MRERGRMKTYESRALDKLLFHKEKLLCLCERNTVESWFLKAFVLCLHSKMIYTALCCKVSTEWEAHRTKMRDRVWSWHRHNSSILPLKRAKDEETDGRVWADIAISGLDRGERKEERRGEKEKLGLPQPICQLLFFIGLKVKTELTTDFLYLPS